MRLPASSFYAPYILPLEIGITDHNAVRSACFRLLGPEDEVAIEAAVAQAPFKARKFVTDLEQVQRSLVSLDGETIPREESPAIRQFPAWAIEDLAVAYRIAVVIPDMVLKTVFDDAGFRARTRAAWMTWKFAPVPPPWHVQTWAFVIYHTVKDRDEAQEQRLDEMRLLVGKLLQVTADADGRKFAVDFATHAVDLKDKDKPDPVTESYTARFLAQDSYWYHQPTEAEIPILPKPAIFRDQPY